MADRDYFIKYIIKMLVRDIQPHTIDGEFVIGRIDISDEIIRQIVEEGKRYEYSEIESRNLIASVAENITWGPSVEQMMGSVNVHGIEIGTHLRLIFETKQYGYIYISLICIGTGDFFVLESQIPGIIYHDRLKTVNTVWNVNNAIEFVPLRCNKKLLEKNQVLRMNSVSGIEMYKPSIVHEIYDSKLTFKKKKRKQQNKNE